MLIHVSKGWGWGGGGGGVGGGWGGVGVGGLEDNRARTTISGPIY